MPPFFDVCQPGRQGMVTRAYFWHASVVLVCTGTCHYMLQLFGVIGVRGKRVVDSSAYVDHVFFGTCVEDHRI